MRESEPVPEFSWKQPKLIRTEPAGGGSFPSWCRQTCRTVSNANIRFDKFKINTPLIWVFKTDLFWTRWQIHGKRRENASPAHSGFLKMNVLWQCKRQWRLNVLSSSNYQVLCFFRSWSCSHLWAPSLIPFSLLLRSCSFSHATARSQGYRAAYVKSHWGLRVKFHRF